MCQVGHNGIISFNSGIRGYVASPFPTSSTPAIAPYWGDVNINEGGSIKYGLVLYYSVYILKAFISQYTTASCIHTL